MISGSNSDKKKFSDSLAEAIYKNALTNEELKQDLQKLSYENLPSYMAESGSNIDSPEFQRLGIWKSVFEEGKKTLIRDTQLADEFVYWADIPKIEPKSEKLRIVMLGESVARGWPVDPGYNPCLSLVEILHKAELEVDVVDLAKTNCGIAELKKLLTGCIELQPDVLVVFAGNNWIVDCQRKFSNQHDLVEKVVNKVGQNDYESLKNCVQGIVTEEMNDLFDLLGKISKEENIPIFIINPEFNLGDWRSNDPEKIPLFNAREISKWYETCFEAKDALKNGDTEKATLLADKLISLFPSNPQGYELKAECRLLDGRNEDAKRHYREAIETKFYQTSCPGITVSIQEQIRTRSIQCGLILVDIPLILEEYLGDRLPGRDIFLDYCHLTVKGINICMYHLAVGIVSKVYQHDIPLSLNDVIHFGHDNLNDAKSHFLAAIHNAHWGQDLEIIYHHCKKALSYHDISDYMMTYVRAMNSNCPGRLNKDFGSLVESGIFATYILLTLQSDGTETFDLILCSAILKALADVGIDETKHINDLRTREHFKGVEKVNLLKSYYHNGFKYSLRNKFKKKAYYREYFKNSVFFIMSDHDNSEFSLEIIHRFPHNSKGVIEFEINGVKLGTANASRYWMKEIICVPRESVNRGVNTISIHWPLMDVSNNVVNSIGLPGSLKGIEMLHSQMYPIVGEIYSFQLVYNNFKKQEKKELQEAAAIHK